MSQQKYQIRFDLLVPKFILFRYDVFPFIFAYIALFYAYFNVQQSDQSNLSIYLRLALIGVGFLNCLTYIFGHWSKKMQVIIQYRKLGGSYQTNLQQASHVHIYEKKQGYSPINFISDFYKQQQPLLYFFHFFQKKYYFNQKTKTFERLKPQLNGLTVQKLIHSNRFQTKRQFYDENILEIPIRQFGDIFREQIIDPFAFFQLFSVFLWMLDSNVTYCVIILFMLLGSSYAISVQRIKTLIGYRSMTLAPHQVLVYENSKWIPKSSYELKPGDIINVTAGYQHKKVPHQSISDQQYMAKLIPFSSKIPQKLMTQQQNKQQNTSHKFVPCDIMILSGGCIANQSIMTGQAIPQIKQSISKFDLSKQFSQAFFKQNILFCGTQILQVNDHYQEDQLHHILDPTNKQKYIPRPPINGCIGMVLTTGFETSKGKLIRKVIANAQSLKIQQKDGLWIIAFLLVCSLITSAYVLDQGMDNQQRSKQKLFLRCILIITTVVPPQLPMILTLAVNNSILYLQKKKIFVSQPKKIPLGGKVDTIAFDKTGTLTEDKFIFEGIVDDCQNYKALKTLKSCKHQNICVLAGCHSLINIDKELTGDPIELMFFDLSDWHYTSKNKQAQRVMQRVKIQKVYPFKSELKRMSTLVEHVQESGKRSYKILSKGAPQAIQKLLQKVPAHYQQAYKYYTKQGYRLLALASKQVNYQEFSKIENKNKQRQIGQKGLKFCGFFICSSPLKPDTLKNIQNLQKAKYRLMIITGDNILTAIKVGLTLKLGTKPWIIQYQYGKVMLDKQESSSNSQIQIKSPQQLQQIIKSQQENILLSTSSSRQLPPQYFPLIKIFARTSPQDKQTIIKKLKQIQNCAIMYAGDGSNDVGGLRSADVGVAVVGTTTLSEVQDKQIKAKQDEKQFQRKMKQLQSDIALPWKKKLEMMTKLNQQKMMKMRQKNMNFMVDDDIKVGDACIAAPFTSKHSSSIRCVLIIIRQSIATLVTTIQTYKILAISSMLQAYSLAQMNLINLKYSQMQMGFLGILASINFYYFSNAKPLKNISHIRAPNTIFNRWFAISFFGQIILFVFANYYALNHIGLKYVLEEDKKVSADMQFKKSFLNTVIFLFSAISQSTVFIVNHGGQPHMQSLLKNSRYFKFLVIPLVICFVLTANIFPELSQTADLKFDGIPFAAHVEMLVVFGLLVSLTYLIDRMCRFAQYKEFVGWL